MTSRRQDVFRPKLPLDPFGELHVEPWRIDVASLLAAAASTTIPRVILVLGVPSHEELLPLAHSPHLDASLIVLATHAPPQLPRTHIPAIRIIRLTEPLAIEDSGAVRLVNVLQSAELVVRAWRKNPCADLREVDLDGNDIGVDPQAPISGLFQRNQTPSDSSTDRLPNALHRRPPSKRWSSQSRITLPRAARSFSVDPAERPFDALINFLPTGIPDKALLKQSILVTTISRPFLFRATPPASQYSPSSFGPKPVKIKRSIWNRASVPNSALSSALSTPLYRSRESLASTASSPTTFPPGKLTKTHLVHVLPPFKSRYPAAEADIAREKLINSIESFLLSFSYLSVPSSTDGSERASPFLLPASVLGSPLAHQAEAGEWTIAELILAGLLDYTPPPTPPSEGKGKFVERVQSGPRAWIPNPGSIVLSTGATSASSTPSVTLLSSPPLMHATSRRQRNASSWSSPGWGDGDSGEAEAEGSSSGEDMPPSTPPLMLRSPKKAKLGTRSHLGLGTPRGDGGGEEEVARVASSRSDSGHESALRRLQARADLGVAAKMGEMAQARRSERRTSAMPKGKVSKPLPLLPIRRTASPPPRDTPVAAIAIRTNSNASSDGATDSSTSMPRTPRTNSFEGPTRVQRASFWAFGIGKGGQKVDEGVEKGTGRWRFWKTVSAVG